MKTFFLLTVLTCTVAPLVAQTYPEPEFSNEICYLKKDTVYTITRLEKGASKMSNKIKAAGFGGTENSYSIEGEKSGVRFNNGTHLSFILSAGTNTTNSHGSDSAMQANGMDPNMMQGMTSMFDPINSVVLYKAEPGKGERKIVLQKTPGALPFGFGGHKVHSSDTYTFSVKKIRQGYWELIVDKSLPKGEYAFTMRNMMGPGVNPMGDTLLFAFAIDQ